MKLITSLLLAIGLLVANIATADSVSEGKKVAENRKKGNCLACHMMGTGTLPGNIAPPLVAMKARFPNKQDLYNKIWDPRVKKHDTMMPPFGKHRILSDEEINKIVDYIYTL